MTNSKLWDELKQMIKLAQDNGLHLAANWAVNMSGRTFSEGEKCEGLKPCPFCGGKAILVWDKFCDAPDCGGKRDKRFDDFFVKCSVCAFHLSDSPTRDIAKNEWNRRPECGTPIQRCKSCTEQEPLACLADRKGWRRVYIKLVGACNWVIHLDTEARDKSAGPFVGSTYDTAEQATRSWLMALPDKNNGLEGEK